MLRTFSTRNRPSSRAFTALAIAGFAAISLAGCGGSSSGNSDASAAQAQANAIQSAMAQSTAGASADGASADGAAADGATPTPAFTDDQVCALLTKESAALKSINGMAGVQIHLLQTLGGFEDTYSTNGELIDAAAQRSCPNVLAPILKKAQVTNLGDL